MAASATRVSPADPINTVANSEAPAMSESEKITFIKTTLRCCLQKLRAVSPYDGAESDTHSPTVFRRAAKRAGVLSEHRCRDRREREAHVDGYARWDRPSATHTE